MGSYQGSKKKARAAQQQRKRSNEERLTVMEAVVSRLLERENLVIGVANGSLQLVDRPAPTDSFEMTVIDEENADADRAAESDALDEMLAEDGHAVPV